MTKLSDERRKELAQVRAEQIIESWWWEDVWEFAEEHNLSDLEMEDLLNSRVDVTIS